jgi:small-conductance mechanosensitive channel
VLAVMARMPMWAIPAVILLLMVVGLSAPLVYAVPALVVVALFMGWLAYLSWPVLTPRGRLLRVVMIVLVAGSVTARSTGLM